MSPSFPVAVAPQRDTDIVENGAVGAEGLRSRRKEASRRDQIADSLEELRLSTAALQAGKEEQIQNLHSLEQHIAGLEKVLEEVVGIGLRGGWFPTSTSTAGTFGGGRRKDTQDPPPPSTEVGNMLDGAVLRELLSQK